jgi:hypothetical protein
MSARKVIKQPTGKVQDRHDGLVILRCPSCDSEGRFFEINVNVKGTLETRKLYRCHHCDDIVEVTWHKKDKTPEADWCDSFKISTNATVTSWGVSKQIIAWKEDEENESKDLQLFLEQLVAKKGK